MSTQIEFDPEAPCPKNDCTRPLKLHKLVKNGGGPLRLACRKAPGDDLTVDLRMHNHLMAEAAAAARALQAKVDGADAAVEAARIEEREAALVNVNAALETLRASHQDKLAEEKRIADEALETSETARKAAADLAADTQRKLDEATVALRVATEAASQSEDARKAAEIRIAQLEEAAKAAATALQTEQARNAWLNGQLQKVNGQYLNLFKGTAVIVETIGGMNIVPPGVLEQISATLASASAAPDPAPPPPAAAPTATVTAATAAVPAPMTSGAAPAPAPAPAVTGSAAGPTTAATAEKRYGSPDACGKCGKKSTHGGSAPLKEGGSVEVFICDPESSCVMHARKDVRTTYGDLDPSVDGLLTFKGILKPLS